MIHYTATYSPEDNKIRLSASQRLDAETYARVKAAGFSWAPKQGIFVAPMWTPAREDLAVELAGELSDEDTSLVERQEQRAERFEGYSEKRLADAERAADAVAAIADNIPMGQPILIGHHSERHARRDAERIENGMRRAVKMWETSEYWTRRAAAALAHAKYKERPDVRARRIATIEAALRKMQRTEADNVRNVAAWEAVDSHAKAVHVANHFSLSARWPLADYPRDPPASQYEGQMSFWSALTDGVTTWEVAKARALRHLTRNRPHMARWKAHYENRIAYEKAMLGEAGGLASDRVKPQKGGAVKCWVRRGQWLEIQKVNKGSVSVLDNWGNGGKDFLRVVSFDNLEEVKTRAEWLAMQGLPADTPMAQPLKPGPICNYRPPEGVRVEEMTEQQWKMSKRCGSGLYVQKEQNTDHGRHKVREVYRGGSRVAVFVTDLPVKPAPKADA